MAANKDSNSSKTAHVMNLLSKSRGSAPAPEAEATPKTEADAVSQVETAPKAGPAPQAESATKAAPVAPLLSSLSADAAVSNQIKDALESELEGALAEESPAPPAPEPEPEEVVVVKAPAEPEPSIDDLMGVPTAQEPEPPAEPEPEPEPEPPAPPVEEPAPVPQPTHPEPDSLYSYTNVMQILVKEKAEKYMKMFGLCCCDKCQVDVQAYALNHLPPKYVVMAENERVPKLTVYESKFSSDITAQLIQACKVVTAHPHHTR